MSKFRHNFIFGPKKCSKVFEVISSIPTRNSMIYTSNGNPYTSLTFATYLGFGNFFLVETFQVKCVTTYQERVELLVSLTLLSEFIWEK